MDFHHDSCDLGSGAHSRAPQVGQSVTGKLDFVFRGAPAFHQVSRVMRDHSLLYRIKSALRQRVRHRHPAADREYR
jgi:hypothetical protein